MDTLLPHAYVLSVMSDDHPGIVAAVGQAVAGRNGNIDACSQTVLEGFFTLIMIVSFPEPIGPDALTAAIRGEDSDFQVVVRPFAPPAPIGGETERFVVTAFGTDQPGAILRFSRYLAGKDINIIDLYGDRKGDEFVLISQVEVPKRLDLHMLQADLEEMGRERGFTARVQHENIFVATNQLRMGR
jgi:glycine cleavage system transcriptional repressor